MSYEDLMSAKKKVEKEIDILNERIEELSNDNSKLNKSKKRLQEEVCDRSTGILKVDIFILFF